jgi:hypothetical protein
LWLAVNCRTRAKLWQYIDNGRPSNIVSCSRYQEVTQLKEQVNVCNLCSHFAILNKQLLLTTNCHDIRYPSFAGNRLVWHLSISSPGVEGDNIWFSSIPNCNFPVNYSQVVCRNVTTRRQHARCRQLNYLLIMAKRLFVMSKVAADISDKINELRQDRIQTLTCLFTRLATVSLRHGK